jgi:hypothetical protein
MAKKQDDDRLILLLNEEVSKQLDSVFERLEKDEDARSRFIDDPVAALKTLGIEVPPDVDVSLANRVRLHLMGDEKFTVWAQDYTRELQARYGDVITVDEHLRTIEKDVDAALREHLPPGLAREYTEAAGARVCAFALVTVALVFLAVGFVTAVAVFNGGLGINLGGFWNVGVSVDYVVGLGTQVSGVGVGGWGGPDG